MRIYPKYEDANFKDFLTPTKEHERLLEVMKKPITNNIIISGRVGTGKTYIAYCLLNKFCKKVEFKGNEWYSEDKYKMTSIKDIIDEIKSKWDGGDCNIGQYTEIPVLIIDEVGLQYGTESERIELFEIFDKRYKENLPTIVLSNLFKDVKVNKKNLQTVLGSRIFERLIEKADYFELKCDSLRERKD